MASGFLLLHAMELVQCQKKKHTQARKTKISYITDQIKVYRVLCESGVALLKWKVTTPIVPLRSKKWKEKITESLNDN